MKTNNKITIMMPVLSPDAAGALLDVMECLTYEMECYYFDEIQRFLESDELEMNEIEKQIEQQREDDFDDGIDF